MTDERYFALCQDDSLQLTNEELKAGWHWCLELDGSLENANDLDFCHCLDDE